MPTQQVHVDVGLHRVTALSTITVDGGGGILHGEDIHPGNVGILGAGLAPADLTPIGDTLLRPSWFAANQSEQVWHGPCPEKSAAHWHFDGFDVAGRISVADHDVHVRWCNIITGGLYPLRFLGTTTFDSAWSGLLVEDCTVSGPNLESVNFGMLLRSSDPNSAEVRRCHFRGFKAGAQLHSGNRIVNCLVTDSYVPAGAHTTGMSLRGGPSAERIQVIGSRFDDVGNSAAFSAYRDLGPVVDLLVQDCYILPREGTNYAVQVDDGEGNQDIRFIGNVIGTTHYPTGGSSGPINGWSHTRPGNVWSDNRYGSTTGELVVV